MKKKPLAFLCKKCLKKMREYDAERKKVWRIKVKQGRQVSGKLKVKVEKESDYKPNRW